MTKNNAFVDAKVLADKIDNEIIDTLKSGKSFKVEAGAGTGKTYSLMKVLSWLEENYKNEFINNNKKIACITYTNAAVGVISERLSGDSFINPCTIHSFAWDFMKKFQSSIIEIIVNKQLYPQEINYNDIQKVDYNLGIRYFEEGILYLFHSDVLDIFSELLDNKKFRYLLCKSYPLIFIDEYQDSYSPLVEKFMKYFIDDNEGIQFGFFGDSWQTIYKAQKAIGEIVNDNIVTIKKTVNFRCSPEIVDCLNKIRPDLIQTSALEKGQGYVSVVHCNDFSEQRRTDGHFKGDLPEQEIKKRVEKLKNKLNENTMNNERTKVLMLTHNILSFQQDYSNLLKVMGDRFKNADDSLLIFIKEIVSPVIKSLETKDGALLFETLYKKRIPIKSKNDKIKWNDLFSCLNKAKEGTILDVLEVMVSSQLIPIPNKIQDIFYCMKNTPTEQYRNCSYEELANIKYSEFENGISFLAEDSEFSTNHGVKGEEYDNVLFVICRGWNSYQFDKYLPTRGNVISSNIDSYERNRNLFYVGCSRPIKKLTLLVTFKLEGDFLTYLQEIFGKENIICFSEFS